MRRLALFLLLVAGCVSFGAEREPRLVLYVINHNYDIKEVQLRCVDTQHMLGFPVRGLDLARRVTSRVPLYGCQNVSVMWRDYGGRVGELYDRVVAVGPGEALCVEVSPALRHSQVWNCSIRS